MRLPSFVRSLAAIACITGPALALPPPSAALVTADLDASAAGFPQGMRGDAIVARMHAYPERYLDALEKGRLASPIDVDAHTGWTLADVLGELQPHASRRTFFAAQTLASAYGNARVTTKGAAQRHFDTQLRRLDVVMGGIDVAPPSGASRKRPDVICPSHFPGRTPPPVLFVRRDCTCGETLACRATIAGDAITLDVTGAEGHCTDCTRAMTSCSLPGLAPSTTYTVALAGASRPTGAVVVTDAKGALRGEDQCMHP